MKAMAEVTAGVRRPPSHSARQVQARNIILAVGAALLLLALGGLAALVHGGGDGKVEVDPAALARARGRHQREAARERRAAAPRAAPDPSAPVAATAPPHPTLAANQPLKKRMDAANRLYDRKLFGASQAAALQVLATQPGNVRMMRVVVSTACIKGERALAVKYLARLPAKDQADMRRLCGRYGVGL